jgi:hypothetical protein
MARKKPLFLKMDIGKRCADFRVAGERRERTARAPPMRRNASSRISPAALG